MSKAAINDLQALISKLQAERQTHLDAIADIDEAFESLGIKPPKRRGRRPGAKKTAVKKTAVWNTGGKKPAKKTGRRKKFGTSGSVMVLELVQKSGKNGVAGSEITERWKSVGRGAGCYNTISMLVKAKKIKRLPLKGKRGSLYVAG